MTYARDDKTGLFLPSIDSLTQAVARQLRRQRAVERVHELGARATFEFVDELVWCHPEITGDLDLLSSKKKASARYSRPLTSPSVSMSRPCRPKAWSTTAARLLLDRLVDRGVEKFLVLHDFDLAEFSILGTLGTNSGRYTFRNEVPYVEIGLRLPDMRRYFVSFHQPFTEKKEFAYQTARNPMSMIRHLVPEGVSAGIGAESSENVEIR